MIKTVILYETSSTPETSKGYYVFHRYCDGRHHIEESIPRGDFTKTHQVSAKKLGKCQHKSYCADGKKIPFNGLPWCVQKKFLAHEHTPPA